MSLTIYLSESGGAVFISIQSLYALEIYIYFFAFNYIFILGRIPFITFRKYPFTALFWMDSIFRACVSFVGLQIIEQFSNWLGKSEI